MVKLIEGDFEFALPGRIAMSVMLVFTSVGHFVFTKGMTLMMPDFIPYKKQIVYLTGGIELAAAIGFHISGLKEVTAWLLILFFLLILPANINASVKHVDYQKGTFEGNGLRYLWFRIPLQVIFIVWTYFSVLKS
ncbi:MAG TPA: hypothetical protein VM935_17025 [Chitinophagaceae bacterium]|nr:hypothetical protein [Chitinophagaceae bacterium]